MLILPRCSKEKQDWPKRKSRTTDFFFFFNFEQDDSLYGGSVWPGNGKYATRAAQTGYLLVGWHLAFVTSFRSRASASRSGIIMGKIIVARPTCPSLCRRDNLPTPLLLEKTPRTGNGTFHFRFVFISICKESWRRSGAERTPQQGTSNLTAGAQCGALVLLARNCVVCLEHCVHTKDVAP